MEFTQEKKQRTDIKNKQKKEMYNFKRSKRVKANIKLEKNSNLIAS